MMTHLPLRLPLLLALALVSTPALARTCDDQTSGIACIVSQPSSKDFKSPGLLQPDSTGDAAINQSVGAPRFASGDILPDQYMVLLNTSRYGLPHAQDGWVYFDVDGQIYRASLYSRQVIDRVTTEANTLYRVSN